MNYCKVHITDIKNIDLGLFLACACVCAADIFWKVSRSALPQTHRAALRALNTLILLLRAPQPARLFMLPVSLSPKLVFKKNIQLSRCGFFSP